MLAVWVNDAMVDRIEAKQPSALCAIPWARNDLEAWKAAFRPTDVRIGESGSDRPLVSNPVVEAALKTVTSHNNLSAALSQPSDRSAAIWAFKILRQGVRLSIRPRSALGQGSDWRPKDAQELGEIAEKIQDGHRLQTSRRAWRDDVLTQWRGQRKDAVGSRRCRTA